jgi:hypothetical protein
MVLPYCITAADAIAPPATGVRGAEIRQMSHQGLVAFFSEHTELSSPTNQDALRFHEIISTIFATVAVVPFRFPSLLPSEAALRSHLEAHTAQYTAWLERMKSMVQMEIAISHDALQPAAQTGTEFLHARSKFWQSLESAARNAQQLANIADENWRTGSNLAHPGQLRCYALIARSAVGQFRGRLASLSADPALKITISGPWPAARFLDQNEP